MKTIFEPFRIKSVEPIRMTSQEERKAILRKAGLNVFLIQSQDVLIDLLTDSGTNAMSSEQWAAIMRGDESYAGSPSFDRFQKAVQEITGHPEVLPTHQGRASERILFESITKENQLVISNMLFDTTRANAENSKCKVVDIPCPELYQSTTPSPFKGNIDLDKLQDLLQKNSNDNIACVVMTLTNNSGGGQPASLANIKAAAALCAKHQVTFVIDGCRFAENAYFIKLREEGQGHRSPKEIARDFFELADVISISAKKDGMANIGGLLCMKSPELAQKCRNNLILTEGFPTYGGLAGRDLDAIAVGLWEALDQDYLNYRIESVAYLGNALLELNYPIVNPPGGHAIFIDAKKFLKHIPPSEFPGQALVSALYEHSGIRAVEIGSVMFGRIDEAGNEVPHSQELVRLAMPRRVYTQSHVDYVVESFASFKEKAAQLKGLKFTYKPPVLRHFTARFEWL